MAYSGQILWGPVRSLWKTLLDLVYPRSCAGCGQPVGSEPGHICWDCRAGLVLIDDEYCARCGDPVDGVVGHAFHCSACTDRRPAFDLARSAARYRGALQQALQTFKYNGGIHLRRDFVPLLTACVATHYARAAFDAVLFVPLYPKRERERTYNQSRLLAGGLARDLGLPLLFNCLYRIKPTATQTRLSAAERRRNVKGAFRTAHDDWLEGRTLLLVDDVMTTGATVDQCAQVLKKAGADGVYVVTVARG